MHRHRLPFLCLWLAATAGCTSRITLQDYSGARSPTFSAYCTGTLAHTTTLLSLQEREDWSGDGTIQAPPGTTFLPSAGLVPWDGFVLDDDGTPRMVSTGGLVLGSDFTSDCLPAQGAPLLPVPTVLADTVLYPNADLSGPECTIPAGTSLEPLTQDTAASHASSVEVTSPRIRAECGNDTMFAAKIALGQLVPR